MQLDVPLSPTEEQAAARLAETAGVDIGTLVRNLVREEILAGNLDASLPPAEPSEWQEKLRQCIALHNPGNPNMDDSRESIYAGRE